MFNVKSLFQISHLTYGFDILHLTFDILSMKRKVFALLLIVSVFLMSVPSQGHAISAQTLRNELCRDAGQEAKASIQRNAPPQNPTSEERRFYNQQANFYRVQAEQLCRGATPTTQKQTVESVATAAIGILATLTQTYGDVNRFADVCLDFIQNSPSSCTGADVLAFAETCEGFLGERVGKCTEDDVSAFAESCEVFMSEKIDYCALKEDDETIIDQFAQECAGLFDQEFPECAKVEEEENAIDIYSEQCRAFLNEGRDFCFDLLEDAFGIAVDVEKKVVNLGIDAAWKIPIAVLREVALVAIKVVDRVSWRQINAELTKRKRKIEKVHKELTKLCTPDGLIKKTRASASDPGASVQELFTKIVSACIGDFF